MAGLLITVGEFRDRALATPDELTQALAAITGRGGAEEAAAWRLSLPRVAKAFTDPAFDAMQLYFSGGRMVLEYPLPSSPSWCDMVLLGASNDQPSAVLFELKHWQTRSDEPGPAEGLMRRQGREELHPSEQVKGYTEYCRRFHSAVADYSAIVHGCVLFTREPFASSYAKPPNDALVGEYPYFTLSDADAADRLPGYLKDRINRPHEQFAQAFAAGVYRQDRGFVRTVAAQLADPRSSPLALLDGQRRALAICRASVESAVFHGDGPRKTVLVVEGPPGSGKSVVAARLWADLVCDPRLPKGNVTFVTTSTAQTSNWRRIYEDAANETAGRGLVVTANEYVPFTTNDINQVNRRFAGLLGPVEQWRENYAGMRNAIPLKHRSPNDHFLISIVDEAHALINPDHSDGRGQFGFAVNAGPQAYHIIRSSVVSIFYLDPHQRFRERETTSINDLQVWAAELGAQFVGPISLAGAQFRCGGSQRFMDWVDQLCSTTSRPRAAGVAELRSRWRDVATEAFNVEVCDSLFAMEDQLRTRLAAGQSARLVASYGRKWRTKGAADPRLLPESARDFVIADGTGKASKTWSKVWNVVPDGGNDYTRFVMAPSGTVMAEDSLAEVGCPYVVRGFDFDWIGLLWLSDVVWRTDRWVVNLDQVHESGLIRHVQRARREGDSTGPHHEALRHQLLLGYRILLTRAMRGLLIWFEDEETRQYVTQSLHGSGLIGDNDA